MSDIDLLVLLSLLIFGTVTLSKILLCKEPLYQKKKKKKKLETFPNSVINELPAEIYLEIFKFLTPNSLQNVICCKPFHEIYHFFLKKLPNILRKHRVSLADIRLKCVNNVLTQSEYAVENHFDTFQNLVVLKNEDYEEYYRRRSSKEQMSKNFEEFSRRFRSRIGSSNERIVDEIFNFTRDKSYKLVIAGSSVLNCMISEKKDFNDIDFFLIRGKNYKKNEFDDVRIFIIEKLKSCIDSNFYLFMNKSYLTICLEQKEEEKEQDHCSSVQINFRCCDTIEELLCFFDLDCCRFAYDGTQVITTTQGIRFLNIGVNYIHERQKNICFRNRLEKYLKRGIDTAFTNSDRFYHPLLFFFSDREIKRLIHCVSYSKNRSELTEEDKRNSPSSCFKTIYENMIDAQHLLYFYPLINFDMNYETLKVRWKGSVDFHGRHDCFHNYDRYAYFIVNKFEDLEGEICNLMLFRYYFYFFTEFTEYNQGFGFDYEGIIRCKELKMLNFQYCNKCKKFYDMSRDHKC